jgi:hypothetical protein
LSSVLSPAGRRLLSCPMQLPQTACNGPAAIRGQLVCMNSGPGEASPLNSVRCVLNGDNFSRAKCSERDKFNTNRQRTLQLPWILKGSNITS